MNASTALARIMIDEFVRCGVSDFVVAPGSRSAPLTMALAEAEIRGELTLHVRLDERSAGYLALGLAKVSGVPAVVVTTSGTAAVNLHPSLVEADYSNIALIAITADRPAFLQGVGANQAIEQAGIFGSSMRLCLDVPAGAHGSTPLAEVTYLRSTAARAVAVSTDSSHPGPVHLNIALDDPLVPEADDDDAPVTVLGGRADGRPDGRPWAIDARLVAGMSNPLDDVLGVIFESALVPTRGVIVVGDHTDAESIAMVDELGDALGWPIIGEPSGNVAGCATTMAYGALLVADAQFALSHRPELVVTVGRIGLSRAVLGLISSAHLHVAVDPNPRWSDPTRSADIVVASVPLPPLEASVDPAWLASWERADVLAAAAVETVLNGRHSPFTGMQVARITCSAVPAGGLLFLGASSAVRNVFTIANSFTVDGVIMGNRGTSGIDGCVSTAWGAALAMAAAAEQGQGVPSIALMGDQAFLYDTNALLVPPGEARPDLVLVVADNDGGGIFSELEQGDPRFAHIFDRVFGVPLGADIAAISEGMQVPTQVVADGTELALALVSAIEAGGVRVIVARTCSRGQEAQTQAELRGAVQAAIQGVAHPLPQS